MLLFRVNLVLVVDICDLRNAFVCCPFCSRYLDASSREFRASPDQRIGDERCHFRTGNRFDRTRFERV